MKQLIAYTVRYPVFSNLLMVALLLGGFFAATDLKRERLPSFSLDSVNVVVAYPDALAKEVEEAVCIKIEEAVDGIEGIDKVTSVASENVGRVTIDLNIKADSQAVLNEIRNKVDSIDTFPEGAEKPLISEMFRREQVINLALYGKASEEVLKEVARQIKDEVTALNGITQVNWSGVREYEIAIEVSEAALREYGLTFSQVAQAVRNSSLNLPGGVIKTKDQEIRLHTRARKYRGKEYENIIVMPNPDGSSVYLHEVAKVIDGFEEELRGGYFNQQPAVMISVYKTDEEDAIQIAHTVRKYCEKKQKTLSDGLSLAIWSDSSQVINERMNLLIENGLLGFLLVVIALGFFLSLKLSFWVALGIPISFGGGLLVLWFVGGTLNLVSMFAMIMALGIVVDDAIVVGENIYRYRQDGEMDNEKAAIEGAWDVALPVVAAVSTSMVAFAPMLFVSGTMGKITAEIPMVMISVLFASLIECLFILPAHLNYQEKPDSWANRIHAYCDQLIQSFINYVYRPVYLWSLQNRLLTLSLAISIALVCMGLIRGGLVSFIFFPKLDNERLAASVTFPQGTPSQVTFEAVEKIEQAAYQLNDYFPHDKNIVQQVYAVIGEGSGFNDRADPTEGTVTIELVRGEQRGIHSDEVTQAWRKLVGNIPDSLSLTFGGTITHGGGKPLEISVLAKNYEVLQKAANEIKRELARYSGVYDVQDDFLPGKLQILPVVKPEARLMGVTEKNLGEQIFQGFAGQEVFRLQRGPDEVKVKVRYPKNERQELSDLKSIRIRLGEGRELPFAAVADIKIARGPAKIIRKDGWRRIKVSADVNQKTTSAVNILEELQQKFFPKLQAKYPELRLGVEGQQQERQDSMKDLQIGFAVALFGIFAILSIIFSSYLQPLIIMCIIPFGYIGAVLGHYLTGQPLTMMSMFGIVALAGIVVNDSLVLIDRINNNIKKNLTTFQAVEQAGLARFRAIILTSVTTVVGLVPILVFEESLQAQFIIPMALAIASGLVFATFLTLFLVPVLFLCLNSLRRVVKWLATGIWPSAEEVEPAYQYRRGN